MLLHHVRGSERNGCAPAWLGVGWSSLRGLLLGGGFVLLGALGLAACGEAPTEIDPPPTDPVPLRQLAAQRGMWIGTAVGSNFPTNATYTSLLRTEFNMMTAENAMKWQPLRPSRTQINWAEADAMVDFATQNNMRVRGHTLAWHNQNPSWLLAGSWSRAEAIQILEEHIAAVVGRYRGRIADWDVVNEAVDDQGNRRTTQSVWEQRIGSDYIDIAFRAAHAADPNARLFYNDYNIEWPGRAKQNAVFDLVSDLIQRGVPIHGVGFQSHFQSGGVPSEQQLRESIDRFAALGLRVQITELDIRLQLPVTEAKLQAQAEEYRRVVSVCLAHPACDTVVVWGLHDGNSWVPPVVSGYKLKSSNWL